MKFTLNKAKITALFLVGVLVLPVIAKAQVAYAEDTTPTLPVAQDVVENTTPTPEEVKAEIIRQANLYGVSVNTALRIAKCESTFVYNAKSKISTAKGVYQFIDGTWKWIGADGHQYDYKENIKQFMTWYPKFPSWWECK